MRITAVCGLQLVAAVTVFVAGNLEAFQTTESCKAQQCPTSSRRTRLATLKACHGRVRSRRLLRTISHTHTGSSNSRQYNQQCKQYNQYNQQNKKQQAVQARHTGQVLPVQTVF